MPVETSSISTDDFEGGRRAPPAPAAAAAKKDEPRPWEAAGLPFDAWLEQDRRAFEAEADAVKRMSADVDALTGRLTTVWDDLQELRVAVALYANKVSIQCSSTERQEAIAEARAVFAMIRGQVH